MATKPTTDEIKAAIETDLATARIQDLIDAEEKEVTRRFGEHATESDDLPGGGPLLFPTRAISSVTTITEIVGRAETVLAANDYAIRSTGRWLERRTDGSNGRSDWGNRVRIDYVPLDDSARRKRVITDLVILGIKNDALDSERSGDYSKTSKDYQREREAILSTLMSGGVRIFA